MKVFGLFDADWIWTLPAITAWLWASGGTGPKALRRVGVPTAIIFYAMEYGLPVIQAVISSVLMFAIIGFGPGYGDYYVKKLKGFYWPYIFILGLLYGICQCGLIFHFGGWLLLVLSSCGCSVVFGGTLYFSKKLGLPWKIAEIITGAMVGLVATLIIGQKYAL